MKFMLMMHYAAPSTDEGECPPIHTWPPEDVRAHIQFMGELNERLREAGELVDAQGLSGPEAAKIVRARPGDGPWVTDGPFAESKEFLAGFWIVDCASEERAIEIAATASAAPGFGGAAMSIPIEVRLVMSAPDV